MALRIPLVAFLIGLPLVALAEPPHGEPPHARVAEIYHLRCAGCHGPSGTGDGPAAHFLAPRPRDFIEGDFKVRSTAPGDLPTDRDLERTIGRGVPGTAMPSFGKTLSSAEIRALRDVLKSFSPRFDVDGPGAEVHLPRAPAGTPALIAAGRKVFERMECGSCHGPAGRGDGPRAAELRDDAALPIRPRDLNVRALYKGGATAEDIYRTLATGFDGSPMAALHEGLTQPERWQLAWYVHSLAR